jgi:hypothetical protein
MDVLLIAVKVGDDLKYSTSVNQIDRFGAATLKVNRDTFPNTAITSKRAAGVRLAHDDRRHQDGRRGA